MLGVPARGAGEHVGDQLRGEGGEQDAVAVVPCCPHEPVHRAGADAAGRCRAWRAGTRRRAPRSAAPARQARARGRRAAARRPRRRWAAPRSRAPRRWRRARSARRRGARGSRPRSARPAAADPGRRGRAAAGSGPSPAARAPARARAAPRPRRTTRRRQAQPARRRGARHPQAPPPPHAHRTAQLHPGHGCVLAHLHPAELAGAPQRGEHEPGVDAVVLGRLQRQPHRRRERGLELARGAGPQPRGAQPKRLAQRELALKLARLVLVAREEQRARLPQPDLTPAASSSSAAKPGHRRAERNPRSSTRRPASPNSTSETGASIPAATPEAHSSPITPRSSTTTDIPRNRAATRRQDR